jgi:hypothetical protein
MRRTRSSTALRRRQCGRSWTGVDRVVGHPCDNASIGKDTTTGAPVRAHTHAHRSDPAWRRLYGLYSADASHGKASGLAFSQANRQALQRKVAARAAHSAAAAAAQVAAEQQQKQDGRASASKKTRRVAVPRFHKPRAAEGVADPLAAVPRRRSCAVIAADMAQDAERAWGQVPLPSGGLVGGCGCGV